MVEEEELKLSPHTFDSELNFEEADIRKFNARPERITYDLAKFDLHNSTD